MDNKDNVELQAVVKNRIGNQSFLLLFYLILIDTGLYVFGYRLFAYPVNDIIILFIVSIYYLLSIIWNNAKITSVIEQPKPLRNVSMILIFISTLGVALSIIIQRFIKPNMLNSQINNNNSAFILFAVSCILLFISIIVSFIRVKEIKK